MKKVSISLKTSTILAALLLCFGPFLGPSLGFGAPNLAARGSSQKSGSVRLTILSEFVTAWTKDFNPFNAANVKHAVKGFGYEDLVLFNEMDNMKVIPWLAKSAVLADDLQTIRIELREGIRWSDGKPFSADDVVFTFRDYPQKHPIIDFNGLWGEQGKLKSVEKLGPMEVEIVLAQKNAFGMTSVLNRYPIVPRHIWQNIDNPATAVVENLVATGPFTELKQFSPQLFVMGRNPYYWKADELKIDEMAWPQVNSNEAAYDMLRAGKIDWASMFIPNIEKVYVDGNADHKYWFPSSGGVRITLNFQTKNENNRKAFANLNFRRAVSLAMDRKSMMEIGAYGYVKGGNPATGLPPVFWNWRNKEADTAWAPYYRYNLDAARNELAAGGFADADGDGFVENADGTPIQFGIIVPGGWTDWVNNTQIAVEGLREIGINASVAPLETAAYSARPEANDFDAMFAGNSSKLSIWKFYDHTMHSRYHKTGLWSSSSFINYANGELDGLIDEMGVSGSTERQQQIADQIEMLFAKQVPHVPLYYNAIWYVYNTKRFTGWVSEANPFTGPAASNHDNKVYHLLRLRPKK